MGEISKTSLYGMLTNICWAIAVEPDLVNFLPESISKYTKGFAVLFAFSFGFMKSRNTPDVSDVKKVEEKVESVIQEAKPETKLKVYE